MPLPALKWKMLPVYLIQQFSQSRVDNVLNSIYNVFNSTTYIDGSPRVSGTDVAWTFFRTSSLTGGVTEAVYGYPPTMSVMSQSVVFAGTASQTQIYHISASMLSTPNMMYMAIQKQSDWSKYVDWRAKSMFNSSSTSTATVSSSGLCPLYGTNGINTTFNEKISKIFAWESGEAIAIALISVTGSNPLYATPLNILGNSATILRSATNQIKTYPAFAGAFIDPISNDTTNDAESDGRIYGLATCPNGFYNNFLATNNSVSASNNFLNHYYATASSADGDNINSKFVVYRPNSMDIQYVNQFNKLVFVPREAGVSDVDPLIDQNSFLFQDYTFTSLPIYLTITRNFSNDNFNNKFLGKLREIGSCCPLRLATFIRVSGSVIGSTFSNYSVTATGSNTIGKNYGNGHTLFLQSI